MAIFAAIGAVCTVASTVKQFKDSKDAKKAQKQEAQKTEAQKGEGQIGAASNQANQSTIPYEKLIGLPVSVITALMSNGMINPSDIPKVIELIKSGSKNWSG